MKQNKIKNRKSGKFAGLRAKAEVALKKKIVNLRKEYSGDLEKTIHELGVHQIELEMQNEELRQTQVYLEASRTQYSDLYDFAPVGYFTFDKNGVVIEANLTGCRMLGVERAALIKKPFRSFVSKDSQDKFYLHRQNVARSNTKQSCEIILVRKDKTTLDVLFESIPAADAKGERNLCRTAITDIVERRNLEQLKETIHQQAINERNRLEAVMEALPVGIAIINEKGGSVDFNTAYEKIWGNPLPPIRSIRDYAKYSAWWTDTGKPVKPEEWASAQALKNGKTVMGQLLEIQRFDGSLAYVLNSAAPVFNAEGKIAGSAVAILDITKQKKVEDELRKLASVVQHTSEFISMASLDEKIIFVNEAGAEMLGLPAGEIKDVNILEVIPDNFKKKMKNEILPTLKKTGHWEGELQYQNLKTGKLTEVYAITFTINDLNTGKPLYLANTSIDITERKRIEDALKFLVECGNPASGEDFFQSLARYLGESLDMDFVCIDRLENDLLAARTVAMYFDGKFEDNVSYTLKDTPCGDVVGKMICCFAKDVRKLFPADKVLQDMKAESYVGTTLWSSQGRPIGLIAIIGRKPLTDTKLAESILQLAAVRAASELERRHAEEEIRRNVEELKRFNNAMVGREGRMVELKKEINEICSRIGQPERYPLNFSQEQKPLLFKGPPQTGVQEE